MRRSPVEENKKARYMEKKIIAKTGTGCERASKVNKVKGRMHRGAEGEELWSRP